MEISDKSNRDPASTKGLVTLAEVVNMAALTTFLAASVAAVLQAI